jgi:hypothetical protein
VADWHYIGNYGQLGPLTDEQMKELIEVGVIEASTFVWSEGMTDWAPSRNVPDLIPYFEHAPKSVVAPPPPPPSASQQAAHGPPPVPLSGPSLASGSGASTPPLPVSFRSMAPDPNLLQSDKSKTVGGILNFLPGFGRFYLGYPAIGFLQLVLSVCGVGWVWSIVDGIFILSGGCREDGYGRQLRN